MDWLMENKVWLNFVSNAVLTMSFASFIIFVFGRQNSIIHKFSLPKSLALKTGLSICTVGALYNTLTFSDPPLSEVILNTGLATLFTWVSLFHHDRFVKAPSIKVAKKRNFKKK